jgi:hypothetical protein
MKDLRLIARQIGTDADGIGIAVVATVLHIARPAEGREREAVLKCQDAAELPATESSIERTSLRQPTFSFPDG